MRRSSVLAALVGCVAACESRPAPPVLDAAHLPRELRGLLPGAATEDELAAAFPDATAVRDRRFGGSYRVALSGEPAIRVQAVDEGVEAWMIHHDGGVRIASIFARTRRSCREVARALGDHVRSGPCGSRSSLPGEHASCADTRDRRYTLDVSCFDRPARRDHGWIAVHLNFAPAQERWFEVSSADGAGGDGRDEHVDRGHRADRSDRGDRSDRSDRNDRGRRTDRSEQHADRGDRRERRQRRADD